MAKVLIDIPDEMYSEIKKYDGKHDVFIDRAILYEAVCNGIVLDGLTNGKVIKKMFPDAKVEVCTKELDGSPHLYCARGLDGVTFFTADWWNRKWGANKDV